MDFILDSFTSCQLEASVASIASLYVVGSLTSVKKRLREYFSGGCDSLYDQHAMTRLAGSSAVKLHTSERSSAELAESVVAVLLGFCVGITPFVLRGLADSEADLVCCVGPSIGVGTSTNVTLRNSIGPSVALCIADLFKTTSEFRTT
jgi:hypothetical protein